MSTEQIIELIKVVGFPGGIALWFMFRTDRKLDENSKALNDLTKSIDALRDRLGGHHV